MDEDYNRTLGVIEAISAAKAQCPSGSARQCAQRALEAIERGGPDVLREQAWFVCNALLGWRGERAEQVRRSLNEFIEQSETRSDKALS